MRIHPIIGTWKITVPDGSCYEIYRFRAHGTTLVKSADEATESEVEISDQPRPKGFYKWVDKTVTDNGKKIVRTTSRRSAMLRQTTFPFMNSATCFSFAIKKS